MEPRHAPMARRRIFRRLPTLPNAELMADDAEPDNNRYAFMFVSDDEGGVQMLGGRACDSPFPRRPRRHLGGCVEPHVITPARATANEAEPDANRPAREMGNEAEPGANQEPNVPGAPEADRDTEPGVQA